MILHNCGQSVIATSEKASAGRLLSRARSAMTRTKLFKFRGKLRAKRMVEIWMQQPRFFLLLLLSQPSMVTTLKIATFKYSPWMKMSFSKLRIRPNEMFASMSLQDERNTGAWLPIGSAKSLGGDPPVQVEVAGERVVVWRNGDNWSVMKDACAHRLAPLSQGRVDPSTGCIECPYHGWQFNSSGTCTRIPQLPAEKELGVERGPRFTSGVTSYPVRVTGDAIWALMPLPPGQVGNDYFLFVNIGLEGTLKRTRTHEATSQKFRTNGNSTR